MNFDMLGDVKWNVNLKNVVRLFTHGLFITFAAFLSIIAVFSAYLRGRSTTGETLPAKWLFWEPEVPGGMQRQVFLGCVLLLPTASRSMFVKLQYLGNVSLLVVQHVEHVEQVDALRPRLFSLFTGFNVRHRSVLQPHMKNNRMRSKTKLWTRH